MNLYLKAAKRIEKSMRLHDTALPGCSALGVRSGEALIYSYLFGPESDAQPGDSWLCFFVQDKKERLQFRLTALCLLAAMQEAGDL